MGKNLNKGLKLVQDGPQTALVVDRRIYPLDALMSACYTLIDKAYFLIDRPDKDHFKVHIALKPGQSRDALDAMTGDLENLLLEEALRARIGKKTAKIRDRIVATALAYSMERSPEEVDRDAELEDLPPEVLEVLQSDEEDLDFLDDPLGIAVPWEERFAKDKDKTGPETKKEEP